MIFFHHSFYEEQVLHYVTILLHQTALYENKLDVKSYFKKKFYHLNPFSNHLCSITNHLFHNQKITYEKVKKSMYFCK